MQPQNDSLTFSGKGATELFTGKLADSAEGRLGGQFGHKEQNVKWANLMTGRDSNALSAP